jgi:hypothetical protein
VIDGPAPPLILWLQRESPEGKDPLPVCMPTPRSPVLENSRVEVLRALFWGLFWAGLVVLGIYFGSRELRDFDVALVSYAGAAVFSAFGLGYRYSMWLNRPPTRLYWRKTWHLFLRPRRLGPNLLHLAGLLWENFVAQRFILRRSKTRWAAHWFIAWGCILAAAVTFPLSFGWVRFETPPDSQEFYNAYVFGFHLFTFRLGTLKSYTIFYVLDLAAVMVLVGIFFSLVRRTRARDALAVQQFPNDILPLVLLFAISVTGIFLTISSAFLRGFHYAFLSEIHAVMVIFTLLYLPFGKFFHIFQRPAQLGVAFYKEEGRKGEQARCARCGEPFASRMHVEDLKAVQRELGIRYKMEGGVHYQDICPACRRKSVALTQGGLWAASRGRS